MKNSNIRQIYGIDILKIVTYVTIEEVFLKLEKETSGHKKRIQIKRVESLIKDVFPI